jgi:hypothetical protein
MLVNDNADTTTGTIVNPDGTVANRPTVLLTQEEAELLRRYKQFLRKRGLREALYCQSCWDGNREDGCKAFVTTEQIAIVCRCTTRFFQGSTF